MFHIIWIDWLIIAAVPVGALLLGLKRTRPTGWVDYFLARSQIGTTGTISNYLGANLVFTAIFLVLSLEGYRRGWWVVAVPLAWLCGTAVLIWLYPKLVPFLQAGQTLHQALGEKFDGGHCGWNSVRRWASLWTIAAFVSGVALEFYGGVLLLSWAGVPQLSRLTLALALAFICATFTIMGGLRGVARVNTFLDIVSFAGIFLFFGIIWQAARVAPAIPAASSLVPPHLPLSENISFAIGAFLIFTPMQLCALDTWQRGVAWKLKSRRQVCVPLLLGALAICLAAYVAILAGDYVRIHALPLAPGGHPLLSLLTALNIPSPAIGLVLAAFVAAILSTADELLNCCGYAVLADFINLPRHAVSAAKSSFYIRSGKLYTGIFAFVSAGLAFLALYLEKQVTDFANVAFSTQVVFFLPLLLAFYSRHTIKLRRAALIAMVAAFATAVGVTIVAWGMGPEGQALIDAACILAFVVALVILLPIWIIALVRARSTVRSSQAVGKG